MPLTLCKANQELTLASKEENEKTIQNMYDDLVILPNLMADPRFYGPDFDEGVPPWEK